MKNYTDAQREAWALLHLYDQRFTDAQREATRTAFDKLAQAYPEKRNFNGGYTDLWLTAIADVRDGKSPWLTT